MNNPWLNLLVAGVLEIAWAIGLKYTEGWTKLAPSIWTAVAMVASYYFLAQAIRVIPLGTSYAIWTGIGAAGTFVAGILLFSEPLTWLRSFSLLLIVAGIFGLKLSAAQ